MANLKDLVNEVQNREYILAKKKNGVQAPDIDKTTFSEGSVWFIVEDVVQE